MTDEVCAALRDLRLLDSDCERLVFGARASTTCMVLSFPHPCALDAYARSASQNAWDGTHRKFGPTTSRPSRYRARVGDRRSREP